ncbi:hypothetical protein [Pseudoduganella sp. RAF53_2]|uniref:hypothetical protein n=1 Tax=unclassified Pseudoduganella TaxID=2637179 RepID=UPI003F961CF1
MKRNDKGRSKQSSSAGSKQSGSQGSQQSGSPSMQNQQLEANQQPSHKIDSKRARKRS